ncbi:pyruvate-formate lyase-activating enzyme [Thermoplasmatales archaeon SCGC AB-540-F20]|nr:pyruvate-formate lyase-activating enzyme [Thermoplasmatales archaeon SCGC AB-540-F20]
MKKEARFWESIGNNKVQCFLCPHNCKINVDERGVCGVRKNEDGKLYSLIYSSCSSVAEDPIEKKPLYHFYPGSTALSLGSVGCNFRCDHCQNYGISRAPPEDISLNEISPQAAVDLAKKHGCRGIAWTYNEPTIWHEYTFDSAKLAKEADLYTVYVTNGYINEEPLKEISPYLDAMNIDVKAFHEDFYKKICKARLEPVLNTCEIAKNLGIHIEVTYLVISGINDSLDEIRKFCGWVIEKLGADTPVHFSRFHPDYKMTDVPATPIDTLLKIYDISKDVGILFPYIGNVPHGKYENTICPACGNRIVERHGFTANMIGLKNGRCKQCGTSIPIAID